MKWETPPVSGRSRIDHDKVAAEVAELQASPGRWALLATDVPGSQRDPYRDAGCEVRTSTAGRDYAKGRVDLYARWPQSAPPAEKPETLQRLRDELSRTHQQDAEPTLPVSPEAAEAMQYALLDEAYGHGVVDSAIPADGETLADTLRRLHEAAIHSQG